MFQYKDGFFQLMAQRDADAAYVEYMQQAPLPPGPETLLGRIAKSIDPVQILDFANSQARLCDEAKSGQILISPRVLVAVEKDIKVEPVGEFALKGIRRPLAAYNVLSGVSAKTD